MRKFSLPFVSAALCLVAMFCCGFGSCQKVSSSQKSDIASALQSANDMASAFDAIKENLPSKASNPIYQTSIGEWCKSLSEGLHHQAAAFAAINIAAQNESTFSDATIKQIQAAGITAKARASDFGLILKFINTDEATTAWLNQAKTKLENQAMLISGIFPVKPTAAVSK